MIPGWWKPLVWIALTIAGMVATGVLNAVTP